MSWDGTYSHTVVLGVDRFGAAVLFNRPDVTISSLCWLVRTYPKEKVLLRASLRDWQFKLLFAIGDELERYWPGHCARARDSDVAVNKATEALLA